VGWDGGRVRGQGRGLLDSRWVLGPTIRGRRMAFESMIGLGGRPQFGHEPPTTTFKAPPEGLPDRRNGQWAPGAGSGFPECVLGPALFVLYGGLSRFGSVVTGVSSLLARSRGSGASCYCPTPYAAEIPEVGRCRCHWSPAGSRPVLVRQGPRSLLADSCHLHRLRAH